MSPGLIPARSASELGEIVSTMTPSPPRLAATAAAPRTPRSNASWIALLRSIRLSAAGFQSWQACCIPNQRTDRIFEQEIDNGFFMTSTQKGLLYQLCVDSGL